MFSVDCFDIIRTGARDFEVFRVRYRVTLSLAGVHEHETETVTSDRKAPMPKTYISRNKAAKWLNVSQSSVDKICALNGITRHQIPGHSRIYYRVDAITKLVSAAGMDAAMGGSV